MTLPRGRVIRRHSVVVAPQGGGSRRSWSRPPAQRFRTIKPRATAPATTCGARVCRALPGSWIAELEDLAGAGGHRAAHPHHL